MSTTTLKHSSSFHWNTNGLMEYMLVINPAEKVNEKILVEKQDFLIQYGAKIAVKTRPHISIANFLGKESMEETLNRWIHNICHQHQSFEVSLNNYSGFPPDTIYIRIQDPKPINDLKQQLKALDNFIRSSECPPLKVSGKPHLTIASRLSIDVYDKAIKDYAQKDFYESFMVEELVLLKRSHQFDASTIVNKFHFSSRS